jgi:hypothetical protein
VDAGRGVLTPRPLLRSARVEAEEAGTVSKGGLEVLACLYQGLVGSCVRSHAGVRDIQSALGWLAGSPNSLYPTLLANSERATFILVVG